MFPSVIPLSGTDCSRVTHPSAARIESVQAPHQSPLDLHVLSTPPAFVLSQDQTLMFNPLSSFTWLPDRLAKADHLISQIRRLLSQNLTVLFAWFTLFTVSFSRIVVVVSSSLCCCSRDNVDDYSKPICTCQPLFSTFFLINKLT